MTDYSSAIVCKVTSIPDVRLLHASTRRHFLEKKVRSFASIQIEGGVTAERA